MRISTRVTDIHSLRRAVLYQVTHDQCLVEKFAHLCSFQLPSKQSGQSSIGEVSLRLFHPKKETELTPTLHRLPTCLGAQSKGSLLQNINTLSSTKKVGTTDFYLDINTFKSCILNSVISKAGAHGVDSDIHTWSLDSEGCARRRQPRNIVVDFSSPNIAKPFHAGHLRSTLIGNYLSTLYSALGDSVERINYLGDWGTQFGLVTAGYHLYGDADKLRDNAIQHLYELYVKMNESMAIDPSIAVEAEQACSDLDQGKEDVVRLWQTIREASICNYSKIYERLGVRFDTHEWESSHHVSAKKLCEELITLGKLSNIDGAHCAILPSNKGEVQKVIMLKSNGSTLYISRDVAAFLSRYDKYGFDKILYVVEQGQQSHLANIPKLVDHLGLLSAVISDNLSAQSLVGHVKFGRVSGMSTRKGTAVLLADILDEAKHRMMEKMNLTHTTRATGEELERIAECLSCSAVIIYDLRLSRVKGYTFNWDEVLSSSADSGPFLQITHSRLYSLERNCGVELNPTPKLDHLVEAEAIRLIAHIARYDEAIRKSALQLESHVLVRYLFDLCHLSNAAFKKLTVKGEVLAVAESRLLMFHCARLTLANGLSLLGITPLEYI